jgi:chloride channel protein, CIC family
MWPSTGWLGRLSVELRAGLIGAAVGTLAWFAPGLVGGGDTITQRSLAVLELLRTETYATMQQLGAPSIKQLVPAMVRRA